MNRVLFITHYSKLYGANRSLLALLDGLEQANIKPYVAVPFQGELINELDERNIDYFVFPFKTWMATSRIKWSFRLLMNLIAIPVFIYKILFWKIDIIYTNSSVTPIGAWTSYITAKPHIWHIREFGWEDYRIKHDFGINMFKYWLEKSDHIIAVSKAIQNKVLKGTTTSNSVIYNGVIFREDADKVIYKTNNLLSGSIIFGIIGVIRPSKGQYQAILAFASVCKKFPEMELWVAGSGEKEYEDNLKQQCVSLGVEKKVKFLGYLDNPFKFYSKIDVVLICSENEGMGRVTAEAMIAKKPIVGLDNAGTSELIDHLNTGLLYDGSTECLIEKMKYCINHDLTDLASSARKKALEDFVIENYAKQVEAIIKKVSQDN